MKIGEDRVLGLKIDVDTFIGMERGVPRLLAVLRDFRIRGTFFLSMGPDASGRAVLQLIKNPLFLKKMMRTGAGRLYGWKTALYGTLLPSPMIALSFPGLVKDILSEGHDTEFHAWDHRRWQDELAVRPYGWIEDWFERGVRSFRYMIGRDPSAFGAPAWLIDDRALEIAAKYPFQYLSCTRAQEPFVHEISGLLEIPSDLPCLEETGTDEGVSTILRILEDGGTHILPVHAEAEGGIWEGYFVELLKGALRMNYRILPLSKIREALKRYEWPARRHRMELLPGRAAPCAV